MCIGCPPTIRQKEHVLPNINITTGGSGPPRLLGVNAFKQLSLNMKNNLPSPFYSSALGKCLNKFVPGRASD